jgi:peptidoglycan/xylan/chitin deacetylase (PgdA/CDA1 family)
MSMKIPVLVYHNVVSSSELSRMSLRGQFYTISWNRFDEHLRFLREQAFRTVEIETPIPECRNPVILTFDDGLKSAYRCHLSLMESGFRAIFFIATDFVGRDSYLSWEEIREMDSHGMSVQSHTCSHPILSALGPEQIKMEFSLSKAVLEEKLGHKVDSLSIPQGFWNREIIDTARMCGYDYIFTSQPGLYLVGSGATVPRLSIYGRTTDSSFRRLVRRNPYEIARQRTRKLILGLPKRLLGAQNYHRVRQHILRMLDR